MNLEVVPTCPLGSRCEEIKDNKIHRCKWYKQLGGTNPQTGELINEWDCSISWIPLLLVENANTARSTSAAVESLRNETVKGQEIFDALMLAGTQQNKLTHL